MCVSQTPVALKPLILYISVIKDITHVFRARCVQTQRFKAPVCKKSQLGAPAFQEKHHSTSGKHFHEKPTAYGKFICMQRYSMVTADPRENNYYFR